MALTADELRIKNRCIAFGVYPGTRDQRGQMLRGQLNQNATILDQMDASLAQDEELFRADLKAAQQIISGAITEKRAEKSTEVTNLDAANADINKYAVQPPKVAPQADSPPVIP